LRRLPYKEGHLAAVGVSFSLALNGARCVIFFRLVLSIRFPSEFCDVFLFTYVFFFFLTN